MKLSFTIFMAVVAVIHSAAIDGPLESPVPKVLSPQSLFVVANDYQTRFEDLQTDINEKLTEVRTAVSTVLKKSSGVTLEQIETNSDSILALDDVVRKIIFGENLSVCNINLRNQINSVTEFSGFESSNCVNRYDTSVQAELKTAYEILRQYEGLNYEVQQIVVRSFIKANIYLEPELVEDRFKEQYKNRSEEWEKIRPDIEKFVADLSGNIAGFNQVLKGCFDKVQDSVKPEYARLEGDIAVCREFDSTPAPF